jgi:hypothetical protein
LHEGLVGGVVREVGEAAVTVCLGSSAHGFDLIVPLRVS